MLAKQAEINRENGRRGSTKRASISDLLPMLHGGRRGSTKRGSVSEIPFQKSGARKGSTNVRRQSTQRSIVTELPFLSQSMPARRSSCVTVAHTMCLSLNMPTLVN